MPDHVSTESDTKPIGIDPNDQNGPNLPTESVPDTLTRIANYSERQREKNPPTFIELDLAAGYTGTTTTSAFFSTNTRLRVVEIILTTATATMFTISFGGRSFNFQMGVGVVSIPFPITIDRGVDIRITRAAAAADWNCYIVAYTE